MAARIFTDSFIFTVSDGAGGSVNERCFQHLLTHDNNTAIPVISTNGNSDVVANFVRNENGSLNLTASATDGDSPNDSLIFSLVTNPLDAFFADDVGAFSIHPTTGVITFKPGFGDFENPLDATGTISTNLVFK